MVRWEHSSGLKCWKCYMKLIYMIYIYLRHFNSNFQLQLSSNASKVYVIELSYIIVFNSVTLISLYSDYFWNKFVILLSLSFACKPIGRSEFARKLALMFITSNCMQLHNTVPPKPFPSVWSNLPSIIQGFLFLPMPKCTRWPWPGESVSAVPSATPGTNSLLQLSACGWHSGTLRWQLSGSEITQLGYSLPLSGTQGTILSRQWKWFGSVMLEKCWNICPQQGTLSLAVEVLGREAPCPSADRKFEIAWTCSAAGADSDSGFILKVLAAWTNTAPAAEEEVECLIL